MDPGDRGGATLAVPAVLPWAAAFALGALAGAPAPRAVAVAAAAAALALSAGLAALARRSVALVLLVLAAGMAGAAAGALRAPAETDLEARVRIGRRPLLVVEGWVAEAPERRPDGERLLLELTRAGSATTAGAGLAAVHGRARISRPAGPAGPAGLAPCGRPGDRVRLLAKLWPAERGARSLGAPAPLGLEARGVALLGAALPGEACLVVAPAEDRRAGTLAERARDRMHRAIDRDVDPSAAPIVRAFATGDRSSVDRELNAAFSASGLAHLLAVSGLNLAIVAGLFVVALERVLRRAPRIALGLGARRTAAALAVPFVVAYTLLVGASPSAVRAAVMILLLLLGELLRRAREAWSALAVAAVSMIAWEPLVVWDVSFQLSFAAVASLLALYPALGARFAPGLARRPGWQRWALEVTLASAAATLGTAPIVARHFERLSLVGVLANVPAHPLSSLVLVPLSLVGGVLGAVGELGGAFAGAAGLCARPLLWLAGEGAGCLVALARAAARLPGAALPVPAPNAVETVLYYAALGGLLLAPNRARGRALALLVAGLLGLEVGGLEVARALDRELRVAFLPVGQGDAAIIELPGGSAMLVDTGPGAASPLGQGAAERVILPYLRARRIRRLDRVVLTHPHADHAGGFAALAREVGLGEVWWNGDLREGPPGLVEALDAAGAEIVDARRPPLEVNGARIEVLGPSREVNGYGVVNDASIVLRITYGERVILLTGDAEEGTEAELVARHGAALRADVLKAGHHGSKTSSSEVFLRAVRPVHVVLCLGRDNHFGFPHRPVSERLRASGASVWRTDLDGEIDVRTDGHALEVRAWVAR